MKWSSILSINKIIISITTLETNNKKWLENLGSQINVENECNQQISS
jgi:hypothetical protein